MIYFVQGRSGTGKTAYVSNILGELAKNGGSRLLYLMPEQSSFESETAFLRQLGPGVSRNINVMSFTRLYDMVMRKTGGISGTPIDDGVRKILMSLALEDCVDRLEVYGKQAMKPQLADLMLSAVKEFKMCGISTDDLREKAAKTKGTDLSKKLSEVSLVTDVYNAHIAKSYIDPLDNNSRLEKRLREVKFFEGYTVVVDDFSGFTAQEQRILDLIMEQAKDFYITLCMDPECDDELFFTVGRTKKRIIQSARRLGLEIASPIGLKENFRTKSDEIKRVESFIYRIGDIPCEGMDENENIPTGGISEDVTIGVASDIFEECEYIAENIKRLALGGECRYKDIAVVCRNSDSYRGILDTVFERYDIPYFMSKPQPVDSKPIMLLVISAFEYIMNQNDSEKLFAIAKSGLVGLSDYETALLENYAYIWSLNGRKFEQPFSANPDGYGDDFSDEAHERLIEINSAREKLIVPLLRFREKLREADALGISTAVYELLIDYDVPEMLKKDSQVKGYEEYSNEEVRLWDLLMDILNKMYLSLGERAVTVKRYYEILKTVIRSYEISDIPQTLDQVLVGTANSVRLSSPYAVFVIGAVNGEFPHNPVSGGVFNDAERRSLISMELPVYDAVAELFMQEKFLVYNAVSAPVSKLFVTYPTGDLSGGKLQPSSIATEIKRILPNVRTEIISFIPDIDRIRSEKSAFEKCASGYRKNDSLSAALREYFGGNPEYVDRLSAVEKVIKRNDIKLSDRKIAAALFGRDKNLSASQVEKFYMCRFQYFCTYGLRLKERRRAQIGAIEFGNLVHYLLENIIAEYKRNDYISLSDDELEVLLDEYLRKYIAEFLGGENDKSDRFIYLYYRLKNSTRALMDHLSEELSQSEFRPVDFELSVGDPKNGIKAYTVIDDNGNLVRIRGIIDRVDVMKTDRASYVRIVDYKTGSKEFRLSDVLYGLNMQMLIYLSDIVKNGRDRYGDDIHPSGVMYMPSTVTSVNVPPYADRDEIKKEHDKKLRMNGLVLDELQVLRGMEEDIAGKYIPVSLDKSSNIKKASQEYVISNKQLNMIFDKAEQKIAQMSETLDSGDIAAVPSSGSGYDACKYCVYNALCGHVGGDRKRCIGKLSKQEVMDILEKEKDGEEEE